MDGTGTLLCDGGRWDWCGVSGLIERECLVMWNDDTRKTTNLRDAEHTVVLSI